MSLRHPRPSPASSSRQSHSLGAEALAAPEFPALSLTLQSSLQLSTSFHDCSMSQRNLLFWTPRRWRTSIWKNFSEQVMTWTPMPFSSVSPKLWTSTPTNCCPCLLSSSASVCSQQSSSKMTSCSWIPLQKEEEALLQQRRRRATQQGRHDVVRRGGAPSRMIHRIPSFMRMGRQDT